MPIDNRVATNQPPPLVGHNVVTSDAALVDAVTRHASSEVVADIATIGEVAGSAEAREHGMLANEFHPQLTPYDRYGNRIDEVRFHPSWHWLMERGVGYGLQAAPWESDRPHPHVRRAAGFFAWSQTEPGHGCPISMTYAAIPALRADDAIAKEWTPRLAAPSYDPGLRPAAQKTGALAGMGMTEKQGGSDVRANLTEARPTSVDGEYTLHGHKWFTSAPMNDVFLVLGQAAGGLTCFLVPRVLPSGSARGTTKHDSPSCACASTRKTSFMGAEVNHLWPCSVYSPSTWVSLASVTLARTSEPPCFSVMPMPASAPAFSATGRIPGSYVVAASAGVHSLASVSSTRNAGTAAYVIEIGQPWPGSVWDQAKKPAARRTWACGSSEVQGAACRP